MRDYEQLTDDELASKVTNTIYTLDELEMEKKLRMVMKTINHDGYIIINMGRGFDDKFDDSNLNHCIISLPIIVKTYIMGDVENHTQPVSYDWQRMPVWSKYLKFPSSSSLSPSPLNTYKITTPWRNSCHSSRYGIAHYAEGQCYFNLYSPTWSNDSLSSSPTPNQGIHFSYQDEKLYMYILDNNKYFKYVYDELGDISYRELLFRFVSTVNQHEFMGPNIMLVPNVKQQ